MPVDQATREIANWSQRSATQTQAPSKAQAA
jgi:hypothetical protein